jgi:glycosyltransferase involved in cell wall biosynthesis
MTSLATHYETLAAPGKALPNEDRQAPSATPAARMTGQNIVCFAKDWDEDPTSNNHIMRLLARDNRVLWLNSIATRTPSLRSGRDITKIFRKLGSFFRGARHISENLWVYTPIVLPFPHSRLATWINTWLLQVMVALIRRRLGIKDFQLWIFIPPAVKYVGKLRESMVVYYVTDEYSKFGYVNGNSIAENDRALCCKADLVFTTAGLLRERRLPLNPRTELALHGVDHAHFAAALDDSTPIPDDVRDLPRPVLGFFGMIHEWIDLDLIEHLAARHPEWSIVMIGRVSVETSRLRKYPNLHFLGRKSYDDLPGYCKAFDVGLVPFAINELTLNVNPIKLREYLSAGLPVVSTALPEVHAFPDACRVADTYEEFEHAVAAALAEGSPEERRRRSDAMRVETWEHKVAQLGAQVMRVQRDRDASS